MGSSYSTDGGSDREEGAQQDRKQKEELIGEEMVALQLL